MEWYVLHEALTHHFFMLQSNNSYHKELSISYLRSFTTVILLIFKLLVLILFPACVSSEGLQ
jgi:hypothetical protein